MLTMSWESIIKRIKEGKPMSEQVRIPPVLQNIPQQKQNISINNDTVTSIDTNILSLTPTTDQPDPNNISSNTSRSIGVIAQEFEKAVIELEELSMSGDSYYLTWLKENEEQLRARSSRDLQSKTNDAAKIVSRLQSELQSANTTLNRRFADIRSKL